MKQRVQGCSGITLQKRGVKDKKCDSMAVFGKMESVRPLLDTCGQSHRYLD